MRVSLACGAQGDTTPQALCGLNSMDIIPAAPEQYDVINKWRGQYHIDRDLDLN